MILEVLKEYFTKSQFHGLRFIAQEERHWIERLFWIVCVCASWAACFFFILSSLEAFLNNPISFGTDTNYIDWNTSLFSVSVCEDVDDDTLDDRAWEIFKKIENYNIVEVLREIAFYKGRSYYIGHCFGGDLLCPKNEYKKLAAKARSLCNETFELCRWNDVEFDCCEYFQLLETEMGPCFSLNSIQVENPKSFPLISNKMTGPGTFHLELKTSANVYVHSPEDVPSLASTSTELLSAQIGLGKRRFYAITEIVNERDVKDVEIDQRRCRYPDENYLNTYPYYSYSACVVDCRAKEQLKYCNCTHHFAPHSSEEKHCDLEGLGCLKENFHKFSAVINPWTRGDGFVCFCLPGCAEPEYDLTDSEEFGVDDEDFAVVEFSLDRLPSMRLKRSVVRGRLDLVVSLGGTAGLFVGASLLSFVEIVYFFTIRIYNSYKMRKEGKKPKNSTARRTEDENFKNVFSEMTSPNRQYPMRYSNRDFYHETNYYG